MNREHGMRPIWLLLLPLAIWALHFLLSYVAAAVYCAKSSELAVEFLALRWMVIGITILALAAIGLSIWRGHRQYVRDAVDRQSTQQSVLSHQARFLWTVLLLLSALSAFAIIWVATVALFFGGCR